MNTGAINYGNFRQNFPNTSLNNFSQNKERLSSGQQNPQTAIGMQEKNNSPPTADELSIS